MTIAEDLPIACTLAPADYKDRLGSIRALNKDALRHHRRHDLALELSYAIEARERVEEMVRNEQSCCAFLSFELREAGDQIRLTVTAPERARDAAGALFEQFVTNESQPSSCACTNSVSVAEPTAIEPPGSRAAGLTAMTLSTGAIACGACCILPFTLPATVLAGTGSVLAWFVHMHLWVTILAIVAVVGAWSWIALQIRRTRRKPAMSTLVMLASSTVLTTAAVLWPLIEKPLIRMLRV
ncbi:hypothetical protein ACVWXN_007983 [Bradyrhizobium sp. i1.4.4]